MFIGLDLGTSGLKALIIDESASVVASADYAYDTDHPHKGWSEQSPALWIEAMTSVMQSLKAKAPEAVRQVKGLALSGHMHGAVLLDEANEVLRPCILWNDTRSHKEAAELDAMAPVRKLSGNIAFPGFTAPKLMWVRAHEPDIFKRVASVLLPKDYMRFWLTGLLKAEISDAAGSGWLDVGGRCWSDELLTCSGMTRAQMPDLLEGTEIAGQVRGELCRLWGLSDGVQVVGGGADNAASACGTGVLREGQGFLSLGTSGVVLVARDRFAPQAETAVHTFCHAIPQTWYQMGVTLAATDSLNWLARITGKDPAALTQALGDQPNAPTPVSFLPYLSGERTPHNDGIIRGAFLGLDIAHSVEDMTKAVLQGVGFSLCDCVEALRATGASVDQFLAIGGGTRSLYWLRMIATIIDRPLAIPEGGAFGAALGAACLASSGVSGRSPVEVMRVPEIATVIEPDQSYQSAYQDRYFHYKQAYSAIRESQ